jgi:hypothetical protein
MPKLVLARGTITNTDELVIILNQPDKRTRRNLDPLASSGVRGVPHSVPATASKITALVASAAVQLARIKAKRL